MGSATKFQQVPIRKAAGNCAWFLKSQAKHARACFRRTNPSRQAPSCHRSGCSKATIRMICHSGMFLQLLACLASAWTAGLETLYMGGLKQRTGEVGCTPLRWPTQSANGLRDLKTSGRSHARTQVALPVMGGDGTSPSWILLPKSAAS